MANQKRRSGIGKLLFGLAFPLGFAALVLFLSGNRMWTAGWIFSLWFVALCWTVIIYLYRKNPDLLAERYKMPGSKGQKKWDIVVVMLLAIGFMGWIILMPLDAERFQWTAAFPLWARVAGGVMLIPSAFLFIRSFMDNPYLSGLVRVQSERDQTVITNGVYGFVRHPMYLGGALLFIGAPMLMGSLYGLILGVLLTILLAARSVGEEKMMAAELKGYDTYRKKVKYRLIPFIW